MTNEIPSLEIRYSARFKKDIKHLRKNYKRIQQDVEGFLSSISSDNLLGDRLQGVEPYIIYKERIKNSDLNKGKSGGYRMIYMHIQPNQILLLTIYAKSDQPDIDSAEIWQIIHEELEDNQ